LDQFANPAFLVEDGDGHRELETGRDVKDADLPTGSLTEEVPQKFNALGAGEREEFLPQFGKRVAIRFRSCLDPEHRGLLTCPNAPLPESRSSHAVDRSAIKRCLPNPVCPSRFKRQDCRATPMSPESRQGVYVSWVRDSAGKKDSGSRRPLPATASR